MASTSSPKETQRKSPRGIRPWHVAGILLLVMTLGLVGYGFWPEEPVESPTEDRTTELASQLAEIEATVIAPIDFPLRVEATGHLQAWKTATVSAEGSGIVMNRNVEEGQYVKKGHLLFELDRQDEELELAEAHAEWLSIQADYAIRFKRDIETTEVDSVALKNAKQALEDAEVAHSNGSISTLELETIQRAYESIKLQQPGTRKAVQAASMGLTQAEQRKARAELALARTRITAPFSGRVSDVLIEEGQRINQGQDVLTLLDDRRMKVDVDVLEYDLIRLKPGASARIQIPSQGSQEISGSIYSINPTVDPQTGTGRVTIAISNSQGQLIAGLFTYAFIEVNKLDERLVLPTDAILVRQGRDLVFRVEEGQAMWVYVESGERSGNHVEIRDGLSPGDTIAVSGHFALAHDTPVTVTSLVPAFSEADQ